MTTAHKLINELDGPRGSVSNHTGRMAAAMLRRQAEQIAELREALRGVLPYMEAAEGAGLVGHEGCHWPVEAVRVAIANTKEPT